MSLAARRGALTRSGTLIPNSGRGNRWVASLGRIVAARAVSPFVSQTLRPFLSLPKQDDLLALRELIATGAVDPVVGATYPLSETAEAVELVGRGHTRGKVIVTIAGTGDGPDRP